MTMRWRIPMVLCVAAVACALVLAAGVSPLKAADAEAGKATFTQRCVVCHGAGGVGDGPMGKMLKPPPPSLADAKRMADRSDEELIKIISKGKGRMPGYEGNLPDGQIQDVLAYIRTLAGK